MVIKLNNFFVDVKSGILRIWNVSKSTPIENIRIKKTGIHALQTINVERRLPGRGGRDHQVSSTSPTLAPAGTTPSHFALPPAKVVCTFLDGGVGLYDLGGRKWDFLRDQVKRKGIHGDFLRGRDFDFIDMSFRSNMVLLL